jgi:hypothetical protein
MADTESKETIRFIPYSYPTPAEWRAAFMILYCRGKGVGVSDDLLPDNVREHPVVLVRLSSLLLTCQILVFLVDL